MRNKTYKIAKLERNRTSILTDNMNQCYLCGKPKQHTHEIFYGRNRNNSMIYGCCIPVCMDCHNRIHNNITLDTELKKKTQMVFEETYEEDFLSIFKRNYL